MRGEKRTEIGESGLSHERLRPLEIGAPAVAGDGGDVDDRASLLLSRGATASVNSLRP